MRFLPTITLLSTLAMAQNITNNGIGSTPADVRPPPSLFLSTPTNLPSPSSFPYIQLTISQQRHYVSATLAQSIVSAAESAAATIVPQNIAIVDPSGLLVAFLRMDNAYPGSIDISIKKARTSVLFNGIPSGSLYNSSIPGSAGAMGPGGLYGELALL